LSNEGKIRGAVLGVSGAAILSKAFGFLREATIADRFGTFPQYDLLLVGIAAPIFLNMAISNAANFLIVPFLSKSFVEGGLESGWKKFWRLFFTLLAVSLAAAAATFAAAPLLVKIIAPSLEIQDMEKGIWYCRLISGLITLGFVETILRSALNVRKVFVYPAIGSIILNITIIVVIAVLSKTLSVLSLILAMYVGHLATIIFLSARLAGLGLMRHFEARIFDPEITRALGAGGAIIAVEFLMRSYFMVDRHFASELESGVISGLSYAGLLIMLPISVAGASIATVTFPYLSDRAGKKRSLEFVSLLNKAIRISIALGIPCSIFYAMFAREITAAAFFRGAFDGASLELTSRLLTFMSPQILFLFLAPLLLQACYSTGRQKTVLVVAVISIIAKLALAWALSRLFNYPGIALSIAAIEALMTVLMLCVLARDNKVSEAKRAATTAIKAAFASVPIVAIGLAAKSLPEINQGADIISKFRIIPIGVVSSFFFYLLSRLIRLDEIRFATPFTKGGTR
jgi:putative peptidoglycan lipid II flippase